MAKVGVGIKLNLSNIDKSKLFKGEKGVYLDATVFIDLDEKDQHGNSGMITQDWKDAPKGQTPILGNVRVFWQDGGRQQSQQQGFHPSRQQPQAQGQNVAQGSMKQPQQQEPDFDYDSDIPF